MLMFVMSVVTVLLVVGMAVDLGNAYLTRGRLSKAIDASVLAASRNTGVGDQQMEALALKVAAANWGTAVPTPTYNVVIDRPSQDTTRVTVNGVATSTAWFSKLIGRANFELATEAQAVRVPLDMSLVLDLSYSLQRNNAFDDLQSAAVHFVGEFDDSVDQVGVVTYSTWAENRQALQKNFKSSTTSLINSLSAISDTNIAEGLRVGRDQLNAAATRPDALRLMVLFTDGRPTAYSDNFRMDWSNDGCGDRRPYYYNSTVAAYINGSTFRGLFRTSDGRKITSFARYSCNVNTTTNGSYSQSPQPVVLPNGNSVNGDNIRWAGVAAAESWANEVRAAGYAIYVVGLGNPQASYEWDQPDLDFLTRIANVGGNENSSQPRGVMLFAPDPAQLDSTFAELAQRITTRLTR